MTATATVRQMFDSKTVVPVLLAIVAFIASRAAGAWAQKYHPVLRYVPGLVLIGAGVAYGARKEGGKLPGIGIAAGAGVDLGLAAAERFGLLAKLGVK